MKTFSKHLIYYKRNSQIILHIILHIKALLFKSLSAGTVCVCVCVCADSGPDRG